MDDNYLSGLAEYLRRSGRNLADMPGDAYSALAELANRVPHIPVAQAGIESYDGALTGTNVPYYGDDEISSAREYFDRQPRSNTSRLIDLVGMASPGSATGPRTMVQRASRVKPSQAPVPDRQDSIQAIMDDLRRNMADAKRNGGP